MKIHKWPTIRELVDEFSLWKMDCLTQLGQKFLPPGYWGSPSIVNVTQPLVCLTFDDGPNPFTTPELLELLDQMNVQASFFVIGAHVAQNENLLHKIAAAGHVIGSHTYSHRFLPLISTKEQEREIDRTNEVIKQITGQAPRLFRPPYGIMDQRTAYCLKERGMLPVYWGVVPEDWYSPGTLSIVNRVMKRITHGQLIVLHEHKLIAEQLLKAVQQILLKSMNLGLKFVSVPELMSMS